MARKPKQLSGRLTTGPVGTAVSRPSTAAGRAFLQFTWNRRTEMGEEEAQGFSQFFYISIMGHVEALIAEVIYLRLVGVGEFLFDTRQVTGVHSSNGDMTTVNYDPVRRSISRIIAELSRDTSDKFPFESLVSTYAKIFGRKVKAVVGEQVLQDIGALAKLRNVFTHGREIRFSFRQGDVPATDWDDSQLAMPAARLRLAGILPEAHKDPFTGHAALQSLLFSQPAMLHFYEAAQKFESRIAEVLELQRERDSILMNSLPDLS